MKTRLALCVAVLAGLAVLVSGCAWGVVIDADTGAGIEGASVVYIDSESRINAKLTGDNGLYRFDATEGDQIPTTGRTTFIVLADGYQTLVVERNVAYNDNDAGTWEVQSFELTKKPTPTATATVLTDDFIPATFSVQALTPQVDEGDAMRAVGWAMPSILMVSSMSSSVS